MRYYTMKDQLRREIPQFIDNLPKDLSLSFFLPFPKSYSQKKRDKLRGQPHELKPDLDNLIKGFKDAFGSDSHVHTYTHMTKVWYDCGKIIIH